MESVSSFSDFPSSWTDDSLKNCRQICPVVQTHLRKVYVLLCCSLIAFSIGAYLHILLNIGGFLATLAALGCMSLSLTTRPYDQVPKRVSLLIAFSLLQGVCIGPGIKSAMDFDPSNCVSALMGATIAVACFSGLAMVASRTEYLYLGGLISYGVSILFWLYFGGSVARFQFKPYFELLVFVGCMVLDTQNIIEKAHLGDWNYVKHAFTLYTVLVAVFVPSNFF
ncbi:hypothetical protein L2E82_47365 [Cichorium intybus]|uniref:Uncharacterized protein n=1 Tax=Cichorium intybus TaxID=13427 RepID=A0ACB8YWS9_CICIN|nr:hypothetical protein L2E82_47365 [Cichorium intybus]